VLEFKAQLIAASVQNETTSRVLQGSLKIYSR